VSEEPIFFDGPEAWRAWLAEHHERESEVWVGFFKKHTGRQTLSWSQAVDQALCFGWIDGLLRSLGDERHKQRFTPRRPGSNWSKVNVAKYGALDAEGLIEPAGRRAWEARRADRTGIYSFERESEAELPPELAARLEADRDASAFLAEQAPTYRRTAIHWVVSAKRAETRERRLETLIADSAAGRRLKQFRWGDRKRPRGAG
jgi:uncharacterized protein YdeI (YjbR/CyaY-like superfamily)